MSPDAVLREFEEAGALLRGHFILSSGRHTSLFLQKMFVFQDPRRTEKLCKALAEKILHHFGPIDIVISPAVGGLIPGYETARHLSAKAIFVEREAGRFQLRRGFQIEAGARLLLIEDVLTTGLSLHEMFETLQSYLSAASLTPPARLVGAACLIDRSGGKAPSDVPRIALATLDIPTYAPDSLPPDLIALPATKPGSRAI